MTWRLYSVIHDIMRTLKVSELKLPSVDISKLHSDLGCNFRYRAHSAFKLCRIDFESPGATEQCLLVLYKRHYHGTNGKKVQIASSQLSCQNLLICAIAEFDYF